MIAIPVLRVVGIGPLPSCFADSTTILAPKKAVFRFYLRYEALWENSPLPVLAIADVIFDASNCTILPSRFLICSNISMSSSGKKVVRICSIKWLICTYSGRKEVDVSGRGKSLFLWSSRCTSGTARSLGTVGGNNKKEPVSRTGSF